MEFKTDIKTEEITRIAVFDMDGTLINTATPEIGKEIWEKATGKKWPHVGWWSKPESLDLEIFPNEVIEETKKGYDKYVNDPNTLMVVMTGRMKTKRKKDGTEKGLSKEVKVLLESKGLDFDVFALNWGGETSSVKIKQMTELLEKFPNTTEIIMWEDRVEHMEKFQAFGESLDINFELVKIVSPEIRFEK
jgi:hypothetical protein